MLFPWALILCSYSINTRHVPLSHNTKDMKKYWILSFALLANLLAQNTTASLKGKITDTDKEEVIGASVKAEHLPTGTVYQTTSLNDGSYYLSNLKPGGAYLLTFAYVGMDNQVIGNVYLELSSDNKLDIQLKSKTELNEIVIENQGKTGQDFGEKQILQIPTLSRNFQDLSKTSAQVSNNSFAGTNHRYNNITLDGATNNDAIGFSASMGGSTSTSGTPGSSTRSSAVSLDAIEEVQISMAPFNVKLGNFLGGSINAITRSGTNQVEGSIYAFGRNHWITGNPKGQEPIGNSFYDFQTGARIGFPIIKNKLFMFSNVEVAKRQEPVLYGAGEDGTFMTKEIAEQIAQKIENTYGKQNWQAGSYGKYNIYSEGVKIFNRFDYNINSKHQLTLRNNFILSRATNLQRSASEFRFSSQDYLQNNIQTSTALELKSRYTDKLASNLILGYSYNKDWRETEASIMPHLQINGVNGTGRVLLGTDRESAIFNLNQQVYEYTHNFNYYLNRHAFTFGTHNEFYQIGYGFVNAWNGRVEYSSLDNFLNDSPSRIRGTYHNENNSRDYLLKNPSATFPVLLSSVYIQDDIRLSKNFEISPGIRFDGSFVPIKPKQSPLLESSALSVSSLKNKFLNNVQYNPRIGFNWDIMGDKKYIMRGGTGMFSGRIPFAWLAYAYYNNGTDFTTFDIKPNAPTLLPTDPEDMANYAQGINATNSIQIDLISDKFKMPQVWRSQLAFDIMLPGNYKFSTEVLYTKVVSDLLFQQVNVNASNPQYAAYDQNNQQPIYSGSLDKNFSNVFLLSNTNKGYRYSINTQLSKSYDFGLNFSISYAYGRAFDITNGVRNSMESNWQLNQALSPNNPTLAVSNFDIPHKVVVNLGYQKTWNKYASSRFSVLFSAQSGNPYTWTVIGDPITKTGQQVSLAYIPQDLAEAQSLIANTDQAQNFWNFIEQDAYLSSRKGKFTERNAARTPWNITADARFLQDVHFYSKSKKHTLQFSIDLLNVPNLLHSTWGKIYFVPNTLNSSADLGLKNGKFNNSDKTVKFDFEAPTTKPYSIDPLASRWQMQVGIRYIF